MYIFEKGNDLKMLMVKPKYVLCATCTDSTRKRDEVAHKRLEWSVYWHEKDLSDRWFNLVTSQNTSDCNCLLSDTLFTYTSITTKLFWSF